MRTRLLHPETFTKSKVLPNRLVALRDYVANGGGLVMVGGYMTFQGIEGKAKYAGTAVEDALPVLMQSHDDRVEAPQGAQPHVGDAGHPLLSGVSGEWPVLLGYNKVVAKPDAEVLVRVGGDPLIVVGTHGKGRSVAFTSDCGPHWAPPPFVEWPGYAPLWNGSPTGLRDSREQAGPATRSLAADDHGAWFRGRRGDLGAAKCIRRGLVENALLLGWRCTSPAPSSKRCCGAGCA